MTVVSRHIANEDGKWYLEVDSKPFLFHTVQARMPEDGDIDRIFKAVSAVGYKMLSLWIYWRDLEPQKGKYDFTVIKKTIAAATHYDMRVEFIWGGTNFCDKLDNRFTPEWVLNNKAYLAKDAFGKIIQVNGSDMGNSFVANVQSRNLFEAEKNALLTMLDYLAELDITHRIISIQIENDINMNQYPCGKKAVLRYINRLCKAVSEHNYKIATSVTISMWQQDEMDAEIDELEFVTAQGISTFTPRVSCTRNMLVPKKGRKFKYISSNAAYENSISHIITALCCGGYYSIYRIDRDVLWDRPGVYDEDFVESAITIRLRQFNNTLNKISGIIAQTSSCCMVEFNTESDGMPDMFYHGIKQLGNIEVGFITRCNAAVGMGIFYEDDYYFISDEDSNLIFYEEPKVCEIGEFDNDGNWITNGSRGSGVYDSNFYVECNRGECLRVRFPHFLTDTRE